MRDESSLISVQGKIKRDARRKGENGKDYMNTSNAKKRQHLQEAADLSLSLYIL